MAPQKESEDITGLPLACSSNGSFQNKVRKKELVESRATIQNLGQYSGMHNVEVVGATAKLLVESR